MTFWNWLTRKRTDRGWPGYIINGRIRTSTAALMVAFFAISWVHNTYQPDAARRRCRRPQVVPPGFVPDPDYTWVPRTNVQTQPRVTDHHADDDHDDRTATNRPRRPASPRTPETSPPPPAAPTTTRRPGRARPAARDDPAHHRAGRQRRCPTVPNRSGTPTPAPTTRRAPAPGHDADTPPPPAQ